VAFASAFERDTAQGALCVKPGPGRSDRISNDRNGVVAVPDMHPNLLQFAWRVAGLRDCEEGDHVSWFEKVLNE